MEANISLAADSTVAQIVCKEPDKKEWDKEAEEKGYRSTNKYLYELVQEADIDFLEKVLSADTVG